jgi:hypothetical protein
VSIDERIEALATGQANLQVALSSLLSSQAALQVQFGRMENEPSSGVAGSAQEKPETEVFGR